MLSRELSRRGIYPAIDILPSLSRLMKDGIGEGFTREDHADVMRQIYASYAKAQEVRNLAQIIGEDDLSDDDRKILSFGDAFEEQFLRQDFTENRSIEQTLDLGWSLFKLLPESELSQISPEMKEKYLKR